MTTRLAARQHSGQVLPTGAGNRAGLQALSRIAAAWIAGAGLCSPAMAKEEVTVDDFEMRRVCACDCVNQYELRVDRARDAALTCRGLRDDGQWVEVSPSRYLPADLSELVFHTRERFIRFVCGPDGVSASVDETP